VRTGFRRLKIKKKDPWEEERVDGRVLTESEDLDLIHLNQDRKKQRTPVTTLMNPRVPDNAGNFLTS
jgi:hypothetical protein